MLTATARHQPKDSQHAIGHQSVEVCHSVGPTISSGECARDESEAVGGFGYSWILHPILFAATECCGCQKLLQSAKLPWIMPALLRFSDLACGARRPPGHSRTAGLSWASCGDCVSGAPSLRLRFVVPAAIQSKNRCQMPSKPLCRRPVLTTVLCAIAPPRLGATGRVFGDHRDGDRRRIDVQRHSAG
jgi:hypothetical protein